MGSEYWGFTFLLCIHWCSCDQMEFTALLCLLDRLSKMSVDQIKKCKTPVADLQKLDRALYSPQPLRAPSWICQQSMYFCEGFYIHVLLIPLPPSTQDLVAFVEPPAHTFHVFRKGRQPTGGWNCHSASLIMIPSDEVPAPTLALKSLGPSGWLFLGQTQILEMPCRSGDQT